MKELFLNMELSQLAKDKGFDEPCLAFYHNQVHPINIGFNWLNGQCTNTALGETLALPLYQQIIDWFREKHNLFVHVQFKHNLKFKEVYTSHVWIMNHSRKNFNMGLGDALSDYYDALDEAIKQAFKLIP